MTTQADMPADTAPQAETVPAHPKFNALKHGLRSAAVLLPGDDPTAFRKLRRDFFTTYQPATRDEAECVESMAACKWRMIHCQETQVHFKTALRQVTGAGGTLNSTAPSNKAGTHICEHDPHRWQHRSMDCVLEEQRLHRLLNRDRSTLFQLQWMRRNRLIDGALTGETYLTFLAEDEPAPEQQVVAQQESPYPDRHRLAGAQDNIGRGWGGVPNPAPSEQGSGEVSPAVSPSPCNGEGPGVRPEAQQAHAVPPSPGPQLARGEGSAESAQGAGVRAPQAPGVGPATPSSETPSENFSKRIAPVLVWKPRPVGTHISSASTLTNSPSPRPQLACGEGVRG